MLRRGMRQRCRLRAGRAIGVLGRSASWSADQRGWPLLERRSAQREAGVERGGDERVPEAVRLGPLRDPGALSESFHGPVGGVAVHPLSVGFVEDRLVDVQVQSPACSSGEGKNDVFCRPCARSPPRGGRGPSPSTRCRIPWSARRSRDARDLHQPQIIVRAPFGEEPKFGCVADKVLPVYPAIAAPSVKLSGKVDSDEFGGDNCCGHGGLLD